MHRLLPPLSVTLVVGLAMLAAPAASLAAKGSEIRFGPAAAPHGYELSGTITYATDGGLSDAIMQLKRSRGRATESYELRWYGAFRYRASSDLRSARASVRFGRYGSLALAFRPSTVIRGRCHGWSGTLTGALRIATHERYFGVIRERSLKARIVALTDGCPNTADPGQFAPALLGVDGRAAGGRTVGLSAFRIGRKATVSIEYDRDGTGADLTVADVITVTGGPALLNFGVNGATIAVRSARLRGHARFVDSSGRMRGDLDASFDDIGPREVFAHGPLSGGIAVCACAGPLPPSGPSPTPTPAPGSGPPVIGPGSVASPEWRAASRSARGWN